MTTTEKRPRGRPRKVAVEPLEDGSPEEILARVLSDWCDIPGCGLVIHRAEARDLIERLRLAGYIIRENG